MFERHWRPADIKHVFPKFLRPHTPGSAVESVQTKESIHQSSIISIINISGIGHLDFEITFNIFQRVSIREESV